MRPPRKFLYPVKPGEFIVSSDSSVSSTQLLSRSLREGSWLLESIVMEVVEGRLKRKGSTDDSISAPDYAIKRRFIDPVPDQTDTLQEEASVTSDDDFDTDHDVSEDESHSTSPSSTTPPTFSTQPVSKPRPLAYQCDYPDCGKSYSRPVRLEEHQRSHTNERPFLCQVQGCTKTFLRASHLKHHVAAQHEDRRDWACDWPGCTKAFATGQRMRVHRKKHDHRDAFTCKDFPPCDQVFRKADTLQRHITSVHLQDKPYLCDHVDQITGLICDRKFKQSHSLAQHQEREHSGDRFWCHACIDPLTAPRGAGFPTHGDLQLHTRIAHPPECPECGTKCKTQGQLKAHMDIEHVSIDVRRTHMCQKPDCGRGFTSKGNLVIHMKNVHEEKRFVCGNTLIDESNKSPAWDGTGACGRAFTSKASMLKHIRTQHLHLPLPDGKTKRLERRQRLDANLTCDPSNPSTAMNIENIQIDSAASILTGANYSSSRALACAISSCAQRFRHARDLHLHLEISHGFDPLNASEMAIEQSALAGGSFWITSQVDAMDEGLDQELAQDLSRAFERGALVDENGREHEGQM